MNNKLIGYEEAKKKLQLLSDVQRYMKKLKPKSVDAHAIKQENIRIRRNEINLLLSIIASEKKARKLYSELYY